MAEINMTCPTCNLTDRVAKVSAIVREGTVGISGTLPPSGEYGQRAFVETRTSDLTTALARPIKPSSSPSSLGCLALIGALSLTLGIGILLAGPSSDKSQGLIVAVIGLILCMKEVNDRSSAKRKFEEMLPRWEKADQRWNQLFYCGRDDTVFNPYDGASMPIDDMNKYLW